MLNSMYKLSCNSHSFQKDKRRKEVLYNIVTYIHIHTLLACPHGAFQSQFYITKLKTKNMTMIKEDKG